MQPLLNSNSAKDIPPLDDLPEKSEVIRLVQETIEKKKSATALQEQEDE